MKKLSWFGMVLGVLLVGDAFAQRAPEPLLQLMPDDLPVMLSRYEPAGGPLQRFTSRPGAWYVTLYLAMPPQWPVELMVVPRDPSHELRVFALDTTQMGEVNSTHLLPMSYGRTRHGQVRYAGEFALPAHARMDGITLVLEQWSQNGGAPPPIWVYARFASGYQSNCNETPWWSSRPTNPSSYYTDPTLIGPPSPLLSQGVRRGPYEIPLQKMPASPALDPFSAR